MQTLCEYLREIAVNQLFQTKSFKNSWDEWQPKIQSNIAYYTSSPLVILDLGDTLSEIFLSRRTTVGRSQSGVSGAGASWEALVCWYLNLSLIGSRTVVIKQNKKFIPSAIRNALTVKYGNFPSNTESDLIAITFPDKKEYFSTDVSKLNSVPSLVDIELFNKERFNYMTVIDTLLENDFENLHVNVIQCKTNWNDNAQIPMLWDMIYSSQGFTNSKIKVGTEGRSIHDMANFSYSFVTVPTVNLDNIKSTSTSVRRVMNLSGGNYWGFPSKTGVASSLKEIIGNNYQSHETDSISKRLKNELKELKGKYSYFKV